MSHTLLIVHPDASTRALMISMLQNLGHRIDEAPHDRVAVRMLEREPAELVLAGVNPADPDALEFLTYLRRKHPQVAVILLFGEVHPERTRDALQRGAAAVLRFPLPATHLRAAVAQALGEPEGYGNGHATRVETNGQHSPASVAKPIGNGHHPVATTPANGHHTPTATSPRSSEPEGIVGEDASLRQAIELAGTIAPTRAPVLIVGEHGTGKTLLARQLHARSPRRDGPFLELSCGALKEAALETELFGRKAGLDGDRAGKLAQAHGGTLFLDEVAALSPALQYKLLRVLQEGEFEPCGSNQTVRVDVRLVVSTREDLAALVSQGQFRPDLYYRISVVALKLPPLRHRGADIERLAEHFRARFAREIGREVSGFTTESLLRLRGHDWPGNVLELENVVERAVLHCRSGRIESEHLLLGPTTGATRPSITASTPPKPHMAVGILPLKEALEGPEKQLILQALEALNWNRQETARVLDINRTTLYKKMKKYGLLFDEPVWAN